MDNERDLGELNPENLPIPSRDLLKELQIEYLSDRNKFIGEFFERLQDENPQLIRVVLNDSFSSPEIEKTLMFCSLYYMLYSKAASNQGVRMVEVSEDLFRAKYENERDEYYRLEPDKEELLKNISDKIAQTEKLKNLEIEVSDELSDFWMQVEIMRVGRLIIYANNPEQIAQEQERINQMLSPILALQSLLHSQVEANKWGNKFD
jgi:hypothetical protein